MNKPILCSSRVSEKIQRIKTLVFTLVFIADRLLFSHKKKRKKKIFLPGVKGVI